jgi:hypothetical protein
MKYYPVLTALLMAVTFTACNDNNNDDNTTPEPSYIRVFDIQHGTAYTSSTTALSVFEWDGHFYGNPALDSVKEPKYAVRNFGDFLLGRTRKYFNNSNDEELVLFNGGIDYYNNEPTRDLFENEPDRDFYLRSGLATGRAVYFPNLTHRAQVAPVIQDIDYYKWAQFPSGSHTVAFGKVRLTQPNGANYFEYNFEDEKFIEAQQYFQPGSYYSLILSNKDREATEFKMVTIRENTQQTFDRHKAYVRFVNTIEEAGDASDVQTEIVDVYMRKADNTQVKKFVDVPFDLDYMPGLSEERLVSSHLERFEVGGELPYIEMDFDEFLTKNDSSYLQKAGTPSYFFFVYPHGESAATGARPLLYFTQIFTNISRFARSNYAYSMWNCENGIQPLIWNVDRFEPTITTVLIGGSGMYYNLEQSFLRQAYIDNNTSK